MQNHQEEDEGGYGRTQHFKSLKRLLRAVKDWRKPETAEQAAKPRSVKISGKWLSNLRFADDIILFAESEEQLEYLLNEVNTEGKKMELKINKKKTKMIINNEVETFWEMYI